MPALARHLQERFTELCPAGWICEPEGRIVSRETEMLMGFSARADLTMLETSSGRKISIEFEISRADPVANHAKFAAAHLHEPFSADHTFVSMMSRHIAAGRRNLGAQMIGVLRALGMKAFQTVLLPHTDSHRIAELNQASALRVREEALPVDGEIQRVLQVALALSTPRGRQGELHFAANPAEVLTNVRSWNLEMVRPSSGEAWKRRRCRYFVHDPVTARFAPSKFAAYVWLPSQPQHTVPHRPALTGMTLGRYQEIEREESIFDGNLAWSHLVRHLAFSRQNVAEGSDATRAFRDWANERREAVQVADDPVVLHPPEWAW